MIDTAMGATTRDIEEIESLNRKYESQTPAEIIESALATRFFRKTAIVSSFGAESAVLLHIVANIKPETPVIFIDTGKLFGETLRYRDQLQHKFGLEDIRIVAPRKSDIAQYDPDGTLNRNNPDLCCAKRKVDVLNRALSDFDSWVSGRKRYQNNSRTKMSILEMSGGKAKLNPLANLNFMDIRQYISEYDLPEHPLYKQGYFSIGCFPCTSKAMSSNAPRSGRWKGSGKSECGIHK